MGDGGEDVGDSGAPFEPSFVDEMGGEVAGDDRFFVDIGHGEDPCLICFAKEGRAIVEKALDEGLLGVESIDGLQDGLRADI